MNEECFEKVKKDLSKLAYGAAYYLTTPYIGRAYDKETECWEAIKACQECILEIHKYISKNEPTLKNDAPSLHGQFNFEYQWKIKDPFFLYRERGLDYMQQGHIAIGDGTVCPWTGRNMARDHYYIWINGKWNDIVLGI